MRTLLHFMDWPLRAKMAVLLVVASIVPLGVATFINIREARERLVAHTSDLLAARADHLADQLDIFHRGYQRSVDRVAHLPNVVEFCHARPEDSDRFKSTVGRLLQVWPASDTNIRGIAILDLSGTVKIATEDRLLRMNLSYRSYVREALRGVDVISDIHLAESQVGSSPAIAYVSPVLGPDRKMVGLAALWIRATSLWDVMKASNELAGPGSFAVLFDHRGIRIAHTYSEDIVFHAGGRLDPATINALVAERRFGENTRALLEEARAFPEQFDRALAESPDETMFRGFAPVNQTWNYGVARRFDTVPWTVFYMIPEESLNAQIAVMTRQKTVFASLIILIALLAGSFVAAFILKPIGSLSTATKLIAGGDLAARVRRGHADELGRLGTSFNSMAEQIEAQSIALQRVHDDLELRVQERTAALVQTTQDLEVEIAERKRADEALRDTQARLKSTLAAGSIGTWSWDIVNDRLFADEFTARMFSIEADAAAKGPPAEVYLQVINEEDRPGVEDALARAIESCGHYDIEYRVRQEDGGFLWLQARGRVEGDAAGKALNFHGAVMDITERKQAENAVRQSEDRLDFALQVSGTGAWDLDLLDHTAHRSAQHDRIFGYQMLLPTWTFEIFMEHVLPEDRSEVDRLFNRAIADQRDWSFECRIRRNDGEVRWIWASGRHRFDESGVARKMAGIVQDITERKQAEEEVRRLNEDLEQRVAQRTAELKAVNRELEAFSYSVSHDLRAPLRHINGFSQALLEDCADKLDEEGRGYLREVRAASQEMAQLIDDLLELARVTRSEMRPEVVNVSDLVQSVVAGLRKRDAARTMAVQIEERLLTHGDKRLIHVMLSNLVGNAWKFTSKREQPEIVFGHERKDGETVYFVRDNGAGFDMAYADKLFGAFQRLHSTGEFEGTGIGLATVQRIVHRHGGRVWAEGAVNQGATFYFTLPEFKGDRT